MMCNVFLTKKSASSEFLTWCMLREVLKTMIMLKNGCKRYCKLGFQHRTDTDIVNAAVKQNGEEKGVEDGNEGGDSSQHCQ